MPPLTGPSRLWISALLIAFFVAGCFSSSSSTLVEDSPKLYTTSELTEDGPAIQQVTIVAESPRGRSVSFDDLQVYGRTPDDDLVAVPWEPVEAKDQAPDTGDGTESYTISIDVAELIRQGITRLEIVLGSSILIIEIRPAGDPDPGEPGTDPEEPGSDPEEPGTDPEEPGNGPDPGEPGTEPEEPEDPEPSEPDPPIPGQTREVRVLRSGTSQATPLYIIRSSVPGPTVMIVGGVHGSETAGWRAAEEIKDWTIDRGTLIVLPQANRPAVQRNRRTGPDGVDLNRQFPVGSTPRTLLAREIWDVVREFRPVALMDLHEGWGLRRLGHRFSDGTLSVGQTLITYNAKDARTFAQHATKYVDHYHVLDQRNYSFMIIGPPVAGSLARKAGAELGIPAFIVEPSQYQTTLETRIRWHKAFVQELLKWYGVVDKSRTLVPPRYRASALTPADEANTATAAA